MEMAGGEDTAKPRANGYDADGPPVDLKSLLDSLAHELTDAGSRHTETLHDMQGRVAALSERANTVKPSLPHEYSAAIDRIEAAMSSFSERLSDAEPHAHAARPTDEAEGALPETVRAELRQAIMSAQRPLDESPSAPRAARADFAAPEFAHAPMPATSQSAFGESGEEVLSAPSTSAQALRPPATPTSAAPAERAIDPSWLEARFADIADRVEQSLAAHNPHNALVAIGARFDQFEQRFDRALNEISARPGADPDALKSVEQQVSDLVVQLDRAQRQLGRLDVIESRLMDLRQSLSDEQMSRLLGALAPTDEKLSAIASAAAERVADAIRNEAPAGRAAQAMGSDPRLVELTAMLDAFIGEQRQGDAQNAEALDTMQQAMQHLIDRVEAIENAQERNHDVLMRARAPAQPEAAPVFNVRTPEPPLAEPIDVAQPQHRGMAVDLPVSDEKPIAPADIPPAPRRPRPAAQATPPTNLAAPSEVDRHALIAMARRAAEKASSEAPPTTRASGRSLPRPSILLVAGFAAFLLAGFWLVAGPSLRGYLPGFGAGATRSGDASHLIGSPAQAAVDEPHDDTASEKALPIEPIQKANLSTPVASPPVPTSLVTTTTTTTTADLISTIGQGPAPTSAPAAAASDMPTMSRAVEMPPALLGPLSLRHAASKGDPRAQFEVAARFAEGKGIPQDFGQAATWYQRAATQGLAAAQYRLGALYERGLGVTADPARARVWYNRAAEQGNVRAMHNLAVLSAGRPGMSPDYPSAVQWFTEAASRGLADSQYNLGILYESGLGVPANNIEAYKWYALAARSGDKDATRRRDVVRAKLDSASVKSADVLVIQWRAKSVEGEANDSRVPGQGWQSVRQ
jgi:localization factor PodJL